MELIEDFDGMIYELRVFSEFEDDIYGKLLPLKLPSERGVHKPASDSEDGRNYDA